MLSSASNQSLGRQRILTCTAVLTKKSMTLVTFWSYRLFSGCSYFWFWAHACSGPQFWWIKWKSFLYSKIGKSGAVCWKCKPLNLCIFLMISRISAPANIGFSMGQQHILYVLIVFPSASNYFNYRFYWHLGALPCSCSAYASHIIIMETLYTK